MNLHRIGPMVFFFSLSLFELLRGILIKKNSVSLYKHAKTDCIGILIITFQYPRTNARQTYSVYRYSNTTNITSLVSHQWIREFCALFPLQPSDLPGYETLTPARSTSSKKRILWDVFSVSPRAIYIYQEKRNEQLQSVVQPLTKSWNQTISF